MKIPNKQLRWVRLIYKDNTYIITSNIDRSTYFLYKEVGNKDYELISKGNNPKKLEDKLMKGNNR